MPRASRTMKFSAVNNALSSLRCSEQSWGELRFVFSCIWRVRDIVVPSAFFLAVVSSGGLLLALVAVEYEAPGACASVTSLSRCDAGARYGRFLLPAHLC